MWLDAETLIQLIIFVVIFGAAVVRLLYRSFVKPLADAEAKRRAAAGEDEAARALREILAELRGEAKAQRAEPARPLEEARMEVPFGEPGPRPPRPPGRPAPAPGMPARGGEAPGGARPQPAQPARARVAQRAAVARTPQAAPRPQPAVAAVGTSPEERFRLESEIQKRTIETRVAREAGAEPSATAAAEKPGPVIPRIRFALRDAVVAQTVLGPPIAFLRRRGSTRWRPPFLRQG